MSTTYRDPAHLDPAKIEKMQREKERWGVAAVDAANFIDIKLEEGMAPEDIVAWCKDALAGAMPFPFPTITRERAPASWGREA